MLKVVWLVLRVLLRQDGVPVQGSKIPEELWAARTPSRQGFRTRAPMNSAAILSLYVSMPLVVTDRAVLVVHDKVAPVVQLVKSNRRDRRVGDRVVFRRE